MNEISGDDCFLSLDSDKYILFYFTASWCGPCQRVYPEIVKIINEFNTDKVSFYKIDISNEDNNEIVEKCEVNSVPTFMLFKDRTFINKVLGADSEGFKKLINNNVFKNN